MILYAQLMAKHLSTLLPLLPHHSGKLTVLPAEKNKKISKILKLRPVSKAAANK